MFGYVNVLKDELKIRDYTVFRAYYCGLCRAIGRRNQTARLALSYDMTFLAILLSSVCEEKAQFEAKRCALHPFQKRPCVTADAATEYAADMSVLLDYLKLKDDVEDDKSIKAFIGMLFFRHSVKKLMKKYPRESEEIIHQLDKLSELEKNNCDSIDRTADCFAKLLEALFTPAFITDEATRRALAWLGYNIGRWIYIIDAFADYEKDLKKKSYNPFISSGQTYEQIKKTAADTMTYTLASAASAYELLNIKKNDEILRNIIYLGLNRKQDMIMQKGAYDESL